MRPAYTYDTSLLLKDAGLVAASAAATVATVAQVLDLGAGFVEGDLVLDVTAIEIASNDEIYDVVWQLSSDADFGTAGNIVEAAQLSLGAKGVKRTDCDRDDKAGRYVLPVRNEFGGTIYRYARVYTVVGGTIATGINFTAFLAKK